MGAQTSTKKNATLYDSFILLMDGLPNLVSQNLIDKIKATKATIKIPRIQKQYLDVFNILNTMKNPKIKFSEAYQEQNLGSLLEHFLIRIDEKTDNSRKAPDLSEDSNTVRDIRLMNFDNIKKSNNYYIQQILKLYGGVKVYCQILEILLKQVTPEDGIILYTAIWLQFQNQMPYLREYVDFNALNQSFNDMFGELNPPLSVEVFVTKIWALNVTVNYDKVFLEQFKIIRQTYEQCDHLSWYFNSVLDLNMDFLQPHWFGSQELDLKNDRIQNLITVISKQTEAYYNDSYKGHLDELLTLQENDYDVITSILPSWIVQNYICCGIFQIIENRIEEQVKLVKPHEKKFLVAKASKYGNLMEFLQMDDNKFTDFCDIPVFAEKTLQKIVKRLPEETNDNFSNLASDVSKASTQPSGLIKSEIYVEKSEVSDAERLVDFCEQYDRIKDRITNEIDNRTKRIIFNNQTISRSAGKMFEFTHRVTQQDVDELINRLKNEKANISLMRMENLKFHGGLSTADLIRQQFF